MHLIYRIQQRISIASSECNLILALALLLIIGVGVRHIQSQPQPIPQSTYAANDHLFQAASRPSLPSTETLARALPIPAKTAPDTSRTDSTAATPRQEKTTEKAVRIPRMNLNKATASQLERLPRIGPKIAARIIDYRSEHGAFQRVQDLVQVKGIGEKTLLRLEPLLFVESTD